MSGDSNVTAVGSNTPKANVSIGTSYKKVSAGEYTAPEMSIGGEIPVGKKSTVVADATYTGGKNLKGYGAELKYSKELSPKVSIYGGAGYRNYSVPQKINNTDELEYNFAPDPDDEEYGQWQLGEEGAYGTQTIVDKSHSRETTLYGTSGVKYNPNKKLSFSAGASVGKKTLQGFEHKVTDEGYNVRITKGSQWVPNPDPELGSLGLGHYTKAEAEKTPFKKEELHKFNKSSAVGNINLGAEYNINKNLAVGVNGQIPLSKKSDSGVNATMKFKF